MSRNFRDYGGSTSRYVSGGSAPAFSISDAEFQRESTLKRRRQLSPQRTAAPSRSSHSSAAAPPRASNSSAMRARSKSKSRARVVARKQPGQEFIALGSNRAGGASTANTNKASYYRPPVAEPYQPPPAPAVAARTRRSRSPRARQSRWDAGPQPPASGRRNPSPVSTRTRSKSSTREHEDVAAAIRRSQRERSKSAARRTGGPPLASRAEPATSSRAGRTAASQSRNGKKRERSKSVTRERERGRERERSPSRGRRSRRSKAVESSDEEPARPSRSSRGSSRRGSTLQEIEDAIADTERELAPKKTELEELRAQLETLQKRVELKKIEVFDLEVDLDALRKRRERRLPSHHSSSSHTEESSSRRSEKSSRRSRSRSKSKSKRRESRRSSSQPRVSKRPCIVDEDDEDSDDDDDFRILEPSEVKKELESSEAGASSRTRTAVVPVEDSMPDNFWGRSPTPKLLANHRFRAIPDGSVRKGRHLAFNPIQPQIFATSPDEGGLILWSYERKEQDVLKVVTLTPNSFRKENPCAEAISWSPDGNRMAMAFRDPKNEKGEFCIVQLHQLKLDDSDTPLPIPRDRITSKRTALHPRGISAIDWLPTGSGPETTSRQLVTTGSSDHAVMLWEEYENKDGALDLKFTVLHRDHRSEVRSLCVHSQRNCLYTGGLDGLLIRYDLNKGRTSTVIERRKPNISKINSVLEHPHNPNLLMVSCVEQSTHKLLLHDLRQPYDPNGMALTWEGSSMSQYVVPRWSPAGYHVSCGSKTGVVNIWDVRMRGDHYPSVLPQQSLRVHHKTVLHATWHPRYDAMFSVSHDRTLGLLTFR